MQTLVALYHNMADAQSAVDALVRSGVDRTMISLVANNVTGEYDTYVRSDYDTEDAVTAEQGAAFGAVSGGIIGALAGLGALAIPGIGPVIAAGPLIAALTGGAVGVLAGAPTGGLVAGLVKTHHMDAEDAEVYAEGVRRGDTLLSVAVDDADVSPTRDVLNRYNPTDVHTESSTWRKEGWSKFDPEATPYSPEEISTYRGSTPAPVVRPADVSPTARTEPNRNISDMAKRADAAVNHDDRLFSTYDHDFRSDYQTRYVQTGRSFEAYIPAYRYGYTLASDPTYTGQEWLLIEANARARWEREHSDTLWDDMKDAVRYAWDTVRAHG